MTCMHLLVLLCLFLTVFCSSQCEKYIDETIKKISQGNFTTIPINSFMFSGITDNNPGQMQECLSSNFSYFLARNHNLTNDLNIYTGLCIPPICGKTDLEEILKSQIFDFSDDQPAAFGIIGLVVVSLWMALLVLWSIKLSFNEQHQAEQVKKSEESSVNSLIESVAQEEDIKKHPLFDFYAGYCKIFQEPPFKSLFSPFLVIAVYLLIAATEFSAKQTISVNSQDALNYFNSFWGVIFANSNMSLAIVIFIFGFKLAQDMQKVSQFRKIGYFFVRRLIKKWVLMVMLSLLVYAITTFIEQPLNQIWINNYAQDCHAYFWQNIIPIRSLQFDCRLCFPWLWLLQADILLTLLGTPFILIFKLQKHLGYLLLGLLVLTSTILGYGTLEENNVVYRPSHLQNQQIEYTVGFQSNTLVKANCFFLGVIAGLFMLEGSKDQENIQSTIANKVKDNELIQNCMLGAGLAIMLLAPGLIGPFLTQINQSDSQVSCYFFLVLAPFLFLLGLFFFTLPCYWECGSWWTTKVNAVLLWPWWSTFNNLAITFYCISPMVIAFTTYCMQNGVYFNFQTLLIYLLSTTVISYIVTLILTASMEMQITFLNGFCIQRLLGTEQQPVEYE